MEADGILSKQLRKFSKDLSKKIKEKNINEDLLSSYLDTSTFQIQI